MIARCILLFLKENIFFGVLLIVTGCFFLSKIMFTNSNIFKLSLGLIGLGVFAIYQFHHVPSGTLRINEISFAKNQGIDWIEIYNPTLNNLSLKGLYLSDDKKNFQRFKVKEDISVPSKGYVVIYEKETEVAPKNATTLNFNIMNGETIYLVAKNGSDILDSMTAVSKEDMTTGTTIGRFPDGYNAFFLMSQGTPGARNQKDFLLNTKPQ